MFEIRRAAKVLLVYKFVKKHIFLINRVSSEMSFLLLIFEMTDFIAKSGEDKNMGVN